MSVFTSKELEQLIIRIVACRWSPWSSLLGQAKINWMYLHTWLLSTFPVGSWLCMCVCVCVIPLFSCQPVMMEAWVQPRISQSVGFWWIVCHWERFFCNTAFFTCHYNSTSIPYSDFICVLLTLYSLCSWQHHSVILKQQCLKSVCHLVMKTRDGLCNTDSKFILLVAQNSFQVVNWRAYLHILSLK